MCRPFSYDIHKTATAEQNSSLSLNNFWRFNIHCLAYVIFIINLTSVHVLRRISGINSMQKQKCSHETFLWHRKTSVQNGQYTHSLICQDQRSQLNFQIHVLVISLEGAIVITHMCFVCSVKDLYRAEQIRNSWLGKMCHAMRA